MFEGAMTRFHECLGVRKAVLSGQQRSLGEVWDVLARCYAMQGTLYVKAELMNIVLHHSSLQLPLP